MSLPHVAGGGIDMGLKRGNGGTMHWPLVDIITPDTQVSCYATNFSVHGNPERA